MNAVLVDRIVPIAGSDLRICSTNEHNDDAPQPEAVELFQSTVGTRNPGTSSLYLSHAPEYHFLKLYRNNFVQHLFFEQSSMDLLRYLINNVRWQADSYLAFNRRFEVPRLQAWYADDGIHYRYLNNLLTSQPWSTPLNSLRNRIQQITGHIFNSVLLTYYRNGHDNVGWHADDESELGSNPVIASLSLGATRTFQIRRNNTVDIADIQLNSGDLLVMDRGFQEGWQHRVKIQPDILEPRINLTFRNVVL